MNRLMRSRAPASLTTFYIIRIVGAFAFALVMTYEFVLHTVTVGLTPIQLVAAGVVLESMTILFEVPTGVVADAYSRRLSIIIGIFLMGSGFLLEGIWPLFAMVLLAQVLWGLGFTFISGATIAWITDEIGEVATRDALLRGMQLAQVARLLAVAVATGLASLSVQLPIIIGAGLQLLLGVYLVLFMREENFRPKTHATPIFQQTVEPFWESVQLVKIRPMLTTILLLGLVIGVYAGSFDRLNTPYLVEQIQFPDIGRLDSVAWFGILNGIVAFASLIGSEWARRRKLDSNRAVMRMLSLLYSGMIVSTLLFTLTNQFALVLLSYCVSQSLRNVSRPILTIWINHNATSEVRATVISMYWQANALGQVAGTPPLGWVAMRWSLRAALTCATLFYSLALVLLRLPSRAPKHADEPG